MAANQETAANIHSKESDVNQGKYKCCVTKECSVKVCINCCSLYHKSCAERLPHLKVVETNKVMCCEKTVPKKCDHCLEQQPGENWKLENKYLKKLLEEVEEKNSILIENNNLLKEKVQNLTHQLKLVNLNSEAEVKSTAKKGIQTKTILSQISPKNLSQEIKVNPNKNNMYHQHTQKSHQNIPNKQLQADKVTDNYQLQQIAGGSQTKNPATPRTDFEDLETQQRKIMTDIINMAPKEPLEEDKRKQAKQNIETENWQKVDRKRKLVRRNIGQSEEHNVNNKFRGVEPKVWMYLYRITEDVTEKDISDYLKIKTNETNGQFIVKDLQEPGKKLKSFVVAADFKYKSEFYQPSFWPRGVRYKRFDFRLYEEKYNTRQIIINDSNRPGAFLDVTSPKLMNNA